jgi:hypothetical protein
VMANRLLIFGCLPHDSGSGLTEVLTHLRYRKTNNIAHVRMFAMHLEVTINPLNLGGGWRRSLALKGEHYTAFRAFPHEGRLRFLREASGNKGWHNEQFPINSDASAIPVESKWHHYPQDNAPPTF